MNKIKFKQLSIGKIDDNIIRLLVILFAFILIAGLTKQSSFINSGNVKSIGKQLTEYGLMAIGVGITMISGGIDLSVVYIANLSGIIAGLMMQNMVPAGSAGIGGIFLAVAVSLMVGALCGMLNGVLISHFHIPAMLATLGSYQLFMGISIVITGGSTVSGIPKSYTRLGTAEVAGIPLAFLIFISIVVIMTFVMSKTRFGSRAYLVGTNEKAAIFAGIKTKRIIIQTYMLSGIVCSIAGLLSLARINSAKADFGSSYTMQCILIVVLGGVNPNGGFGSIPGIAVAVVILQVLSSYLNMFPDISNYYRDLIWGVALIAVLIVNYVIGSRKINILGRAGRISKEV